MRILLDMDGVTVDIYPVWLELINRYYHEGLKVSDLIEWDFAKFCKNATPDQVYGFLSEPGFFRHLPPMPGAMMAVRNLIAAGHEIVFVTACTHGHTDKRAWIKRHFPTFPMRNIIFAERKELVRGDILIDDNQDNLKAWGAENPDGAAICYGQPHNRNYDGLRYANWMQVLQVIEAK